MISDDHDCFCDGCEECFDVYPEEPMLRLVPADPDPLEFPTRAFACDSREDPRFSPCPYCDVEVCPHGMCNAACDCDEGGWEDDEIA